MSSGGCVKNSNLAGKSDTGTKDRYEKELGLLPEVQAHPFRSTEVIAVIDPMRRLERKMSRLTSAFILLTIVLVALGLADPWATIHAALDELAQWWR